MGENTETSIISSNADLVKLSRVPVLLEQIRPAWKAKRLIDRVQNLLSVDPSSACQRLLNAAIHDLKEKVFIAGLDIASEAAKIHRLPSVESKDDIENYSTARIIDLAYRMGLLSRPEWRRVARCYEIRRDLEHEDNEYEAGLADCIYIFETCIEAILQKDPIHLLKVTDVKEIVEKSEPVSASDTLVDDFDHAPQPRQTEILKFLISIALDKDKSDIVQQNAFSLLNGLKSYVKNQVKLEVAEYFQEKVGRNKLDTRHVRVALASGSLPYLRQNQLIDFFNEVFEGMKQIGTHWTAHEEHGALLRSFKEVGGIGYCPKKVRKDIVLWLILTYIGTLGGKTSYGNIRHVYYSNTAAPIIWEIFSESAAMVRNQVIDLQSHDKIKNLTTDKHIARRMESLIDLIENED